MWLGNPLSYILVRPVPWLWVSTPLGLLMTLRSHGTLMSAMCQIQVSLVVLIPLFRFLNCSHSAIMQLHSFIPIETAVFCHHSDVQCLLHLEFLVSASSVQNLSASPFYRVIMFPGMLSQGQFLQLSSNTSIPVLFHPGLQSLNGLSYICLPT